MVCRGKEDEEEKRKTCRGDREEKKDFWIEFFFTREILLMLLLQVGVLLVLRACLCASPYSNPEDRGTLGGVAM